MSQPRDEALILEWPANPESPDFGELDPQQYKAARDAHRLFVAMGEQEDSTAPEDSKLEVFLPRLDAHRRNHTVLIDGLRGSGKTGVMLRLLHDWSETLRGKRASIMHFPAEVSLDGKVTFIPVGLLDLEAVPRTANLATRIAGMFGRIIAAMEPGAAASGRIPSAPPWAELEGDVLPSRATWQRFMKAAALEWDRTLERRRANVDPEAYAVEVEQAEHEGLRARECFRVFVDKLAVDWKKWRRDERRPFFIVPIDDADLAPGRVVELFELMRTLWHPRVGYLLTGDSGLFERVLTTDFRSRIDMPQLDSNAWGNGKVQLTSDEERQAEKLARDLHQKAVPTAQRLRIEPLASTRRIEFVRTELSTIVAADASRESLADYLDADTFSSYALPGRWRQLVDLRNSLRRGEFARPHGAERLALVLWENALDGLPIEERIRRDLRDLAYIDEHQGVLMVPPASKVTIGLAPVCVRTENGSVGPVRVYSRLKFGAVYYHTFVEGADTRHVRHLDEPTTAVLLLLNNLLRCQEPELRPAQEEPFSLPLVETSYSYSSPPPSGPRGAQAAGTRLDLIFRWPIPAWKQQFEKQRLCMRWGEHGLVAYESLESLARRFLTLVLQLSEYEVKGEASWEAISTNVVAASRDSETELGRWAREYAGLIAAPESGLPVADANAWLTALKNKAEQDGVWEGMSASLQASRHERFRYAMAEFATARREAAKRTRPSISPYGPDQSPPPVHSDLLNTTINAIASGYAWKTLIDKVPAA